MQKKLYLVLPLLLLVFALAAPEIAFSSQLEAQKISEIKANGAETLWAFAKRLPSSFEAQVFYGLFISGLIGMIFSWAWKWSKDEALGFEHFIARDKTGLARYRYPIGQVLWLVISSGGVIAVTGFATESGEFFGWLTVVVMGVSLGFNGEIKTKE